MKLRRATVCFIALAVLPLLSGDPARAAGFEVIDQSCKSLGEACAEGITDISDASSIFYNPAAMAWMKKNEVAVVGNLLVGSTDFRDQGSTTAEGQPLTGDEGGKVHHQSAPSVYCVAGLADRVKLGLGVSTPFGLASGYESHWQGRYHEIETVLSNVTFSPALAVRLTDIFSIGGSINIQYLEARLTNAIDFGTILSAAGTVPQTLDGLSDFTANGWDFGGSLGILANLPTGTRIGISFRSQVDHRLEGRSDFDVPDAARQILDLWGMTNYFVDTGSRTEIVTPESVSLGLAQEITGGWEADAAIAWTRWSCFRELAISYDSGQPDDVTEEHWNDTLRYSLGLSWAATASLTLRIGTAYDESPVETAYRTPQRPDGDHFWLALGAGWRFSESFGLDIGYAHLFIPESESRLTNKPEAGYLIGEYKAAVDIGGFELSWRF